MGEKLGLDTDRDKGGYKYFSMRSVQIFDMFEQTFGGTERLVRVMGSWTGYSRLSEMLLTYRNAYKKTDALAIAPYFYTDHKKIKTIRSVNDIFKRLYDKKERYSITSIGELIKKHSDVTDKLGIDLIAYEGGQHLVDWKSRDIKSHPTNLFIAANRDPRMGRAYLDFMKVWKKAGGKLFVNFSAPRTYQWFGSWGTKEYITQSLNKAPKHRALLQFARSNKCWWRGCTSRTIARFDKPANNPLGDIYALVPSKDKNGKIIKTAKKKRSVIGTEVPKTVIAKNTVKKAAPVKQVVKAPTKQQPPSIKSVASVSPSSLPIWERNVINHVLTHDIPHANERKKIQKQIHSVSKAVAHTNSPTKKVTPQRVVALPPHHAVIHRVTDHKRIWKNNKSIRINNKLGGNISGYNDLSAVWQSHWDNNNLYIRVDAIDDKFVRDSKNPWGDDSIELYIDADGSRSAHYDGKNDFHLIYRWKDYKVNLSQNSPRRGNMNIQQTMTKTNKGYSLETAIPWKSLGIKPLAGKAIGIDVQINDDDNGKDRDAKLAWHAKQDTSWKNPKQFGRLVLGL